MDKLTMAHEYAMQHLKNSGGKITMHSLCSFAWEYADAMQAEADERVNKDRSDVLQEWQPDWSQAPDNAICWRMNLIDREKANWICKRDGVDIDTYYVDAPTFGYIGNWQDSLRKRP